MNFCRFCTTAGVRSSIKRLAAAPYKLCYLDSDKCNKSYCNSESRSFCNLGLLSRLKTNDSKYPLTADTFNSLNPKKQEKFPLFFQQIRQHTNLGAISADEKANIFQRPKAQSTIDEEEVSKFSGLSALWWDEGGEFEALHSLNELRIPLIRDALVSKKNLDQYDPASPLQGFWILDVGSGGGILSEPLARLGASVIGLEASEETIKIAQAHLIHDVQIRDSVKYIKSTVEDIALTQEGKFDAVVASEVLEHVSDAQTFVTAACKLVRPGGSIFFTTLNKTQLAYALGIVAAENILHLVTPGTHDWEKFVPPTVLQHMLDKNNFATRLIHGMWYNPLSKRWSWTKDTSINYALHAVKPSTGEEGDVWKERKP
ncbi:unnamed protein product [Lymnaea stagnalis]|uniref:Ubiquinone biosynthesis O-methyltransferase, mitochondrial n=1 Tax=Lymnaea stagnalis TaxID=6523 RepID=A0AAV2I2V6_LYMST